MTWLYHLLLAVVVAVAAYHVWQNRTVLAAFAAGVGTACLGVLLAVALGRELFDMMRLACWGLFLHLPVCLLVAAACLWTSRRRWAGVGIATAASLVAIAIDAFWIEPHWLEVTHYTLSSSKLRTPLTIALVADLQTDEVGEYDRSVLERVKAEQPDLVLWAGDYIQVRSDEAWREQAGRLNGLLREIDLRPPLGAFAVEGNIEQIFRPPRWGEVFARTETVAWTAGRRTQRLARDDITLVGLTLGESQNGSLEVGPAEGDGFQIVLGHCPDFALGKVAADLLVAGHTHGGQVRLPWLGPPITLSKVPRNWAAGRTDLDGGRTLIVSRGIGMERDHAPRLRFLCRPQLVFITVEPVEPTAR